MVEKPIIHIENIHKHFGNCVALDGVSLDVAKGEVVVVIGPSGSGKSTLLRCINRLEEFDAGEIVVDGIPLDMPRTSTPCAPKLGMVFQQFNLFPHLTVLENIMPGAADRAQTQRTKKRTRLRTQAAGEGGHPRKGRCLSRPAFGRAAAARGDCPRPGDEPQDHAVRRADQRPGPGNDPGGAGRDAQPGQGRHDHGGGLARDGFARAAADRVIFMDGGQIIEEAPPGDPVQ